MSSPRGNKRKIPMKKPKAKKNKKNNVGTSASGRTLTPLNNNPMSVGTIPPALPILPVLPALPGSLRDLGVNTTTRFKRGNNLREDLEALQGHNDFVIWDEDDFDVGNDVLISRGGKGEGGKTLEVYMIRDSFGIKVKLQQTAIPKAPQDLPSRQTSLSKKDYRDKNYFNNLYEGDNLSIKTNTKEQIENADVKNLYSKKENGNFYTALMVYDSIPVSESGRETITTKKLKKILVLDLEDVKNMAKRNYKNLIKDYEKKGSMRDKQREAKSIIVKLRKQGIKSSGTVEQMAKFRDKESNPLVIADYNKIIKLKNEIEILQNKWQKKLNRGVVGKDIITLSPKTNWENARLVHTIHITPDSSFFNMDIDHNEGANNYFLGKNINSFRNITAIVNKFRKGSEASLPLEERIKVYNKMNEEDGGHYLAENFSFEELNFMITMNGLEINKDSEDELSELINSIISLKLAGINIIEDISNFGLNGIKNDEERDILIKSIMDKYEEVINNKNISETGILTQELTNVLKNTFTNKQLDIIINKFNIPKEKEIMNHQERVELLMENFIEILERERPDLIDNFMEILNDGLGDVIDRGEIAKTNREIEIEEKEDELNERLDRQEQQVDDLNLNDIISTLVGSKEINDEITFNRVLNRVTRRDLIEIGINIDIIPNAENFTEEEIDNQLSQLTNQNLKEFIEIVIDGAKNINNPGDEVESDNEKIERLRRELAWITVAFINSNKGNNFKNFKRFLNREKTQEEIKEILIFHFSKRNPDDFLKMSEEELNNQFVKLLSKDKNRNTILRLRGGDDNENDEEFVKDFEEKLDDAAEDVAFEALEEAKDELLNEIKRDMGL